MNRSNLAPTSGRRLKKIKKISKIMTISLISVTTIALLFLGAVGKGTFSLPMVRSTVDSNGGSVRQQKYTISHGQINGSPAMPDDESDDDTAGILDDPEYFTEDPLGISIYDDIFSKQDKAAIPKGELEIIANDLSKNPSYGTVYLKNNTSYTVKASDYISNDLVLPRISENAEPISDSPLVLIYHTHGTEGYAEEGKVSYLKKDLPRSNDITKNVVAVGQVLADTLTEYGIPTIHCETMFDAGGNYNHAYASSLEGILKILKQYPSIRYIFDVHRDALTNSTATYKVLTYDESTPTAQIMLVVGTNASGADHPSWKDNLSFAVNIQNQLTKRLNSLMRPICIKTYSYSQYLSDRSLLIEMGTCVNTLSEAKHSAKLLGQTLAAFITAETKK